MKEGEEAATTDTALILFQDLEKGQVKEILGWLRSGKTFF